MNEIDALLGLDISDEEKMRVLSDQLRGKKRAADFFALSTVEPIQRAAAGKQQDILQSAQQAGVLNRAMQERAASEEEARLQRELTASEGEANRANALQRTLISAASRGQGGGGRQALGSSYGGLKSRQERESFESAGQELANATSLLGTWKDDFAPYIPLTGNISNWVGKNLPEDWGLAEKSNWWSNLEMLHNLPKRHKFFGSAFTAAEQKAWDKAFFDANAKPELVRNRLQTIQQMALRLAEYQVLKGYEAGVSPDILELNYGDQLDVHALIDTWENDREAYQTKRAMDQQAALEFIADEDPNSKWKMGDEEWVPDEEYLRANGPETLPSLSDAEEQEFQELMRKAQGGL